MLCFANGFTLALCFGFGVGLFILTGRLMVSCLWTCAYWIAVNLAWLVFTCL